MHPALDAVAEKLEDLLSAVDEAGSRMLVERLALALQASVLLGAGSPVAEAFCRSRLGGEHGLALGTLPAGVDCASVMDCALPE